MLPAVRPALDPLAHRAAIQALEAQRAAFSRYAQTVDAHREAVGSGSGEQASAAASEATRGYAALAEGAQALGSVLAGVVGAGTDDQAAEVQRQAEAMMQAARAAETAIHNLTTQLEAWRDAYARQLAGVGLTPGAGDGETAVGGVGVAGGAGGVGSGGAAPDGGAPALGAGVGAARATGYGPRGRQLRPGVPGVSLIDRKG